MHRIDQTEGSDRTALSKVDHRDSRRRTEFPFGLNALRLKVGFRALEPSTRIEASFILAVAVWPYERFTAETVAVPGR